MEASAVADLRARLLGWYDAHRRDLPWRRTSDPYAVWISEVMLQQTRVSTVIPYYERFMARWPTVRELAAADRDELRAAWSGLGYYRRLELLARAAEVVVESHGGALPGSYEALRALPGFGDYTAGAVASIAYGQPAAAVDGNVARALARLHGLREDPVRGAGARALRAHAERLAPGERPGDLTQALIELGATVCTPRSPRCGACPVSGACVARSLDLVASIPPTRRRPARAQVPLTALFSLAPEGVLLERRAAGGLFASMWCLPTHPGTLEGEALREAELAASGAAPASAALVAEVRHLLTHRELQIRVMAVEGLPVEATAPRARVPLGDLGGLGLPAVTVKLLRAALPRRVASTLALPGRTTARPAGTLELPLGSDGST